MVLPAAISAQLRELALLPIESGGVLLARAVTTDGGDLRILIHEMCLVPEHAYATREADRLEITSDGYVPPLRLAAESGSFAIWMHTHPGHGSSVQSSHHDRIVDQQLAEPFRIRSGSDLYGALIVSTTQSGDGLRFMCHLDGDTGAVHYVDRLLTVGSQIRVVEAEGLRPSPVAEMFNRHVRAFGGTVQNTLGNLRVAVVGCGGTGSCVAEQLVRLGVRNLLLIDPEPLSESNLTRVYGSVATDVGRPKVDVVTDHLRAIAPDVSVESVRGMVTREPVARRLTDADVIFGCTDDNAGRLVLSRLSTYMMIPVIDCGVLLSSGEEGHLLGIDGRITLMYPEAACLVCRGRVDLPRAASEVLTPDERIRRVDEGYAPGLADNEPAVVAFTSVVAASAVAELLNMLIGYGPEPAPTEVLLRLHDREVSTNIAKPQPKHYCDPASGKIGLGMTVPFLEQTWPS
jgi:molybdopterin/thiamine biosynthesis adenylyltransferase